MSEVTTSLGGKLPTSDGNGLADMGAELATDPGKIRAAVILFDCAEVTRKTDTGERVAKVRIRRIEAIKNPQDSAVMQRLLMRAFELRTGQTVLPFELEEDVMKAFEDVIAEMAEEPDFKLDSVEE